MSASPFDGSCDHRDIRTFYTSELAYLCAMRKRYACAYCGTAAAYCPSCSRRNERITVLADAEDRSVKRQDAMSDRDPIAETADLRAQLAALEAVALELIAERDRAVGELERVSQMSLIGEGAA